MTFKRTCIVVACICLSIVGFTLHIHQLFAMAASLALLPLISRLVSRKKLHNIEVHRKAPNAANCGEKVDVELAVRNTGPTRKVFFGVTEYLPSSLSREGQQEFPVAILGPGEATHIRYAVQTTRRGAYQLGPVTLTTGDAVGLQQYQRTLDAVSELLVYPQAVHLPYSWPNSQGARQPVKPRHRVRGEGDEIYGVRDYLPGDDPRHISWKISARRGDLTVVEYERPESLQGMILLDLEGLWHGGKDDAHTLEYGVTLAASLIEQAYERGSTVGLIAAGARDFSLPSLTEVEQRLRLYEALARVEPDGHVPLTQVLADHQDLVPPHASVAVISPSPEAGAVAMTLRGLGHPVAWFVLDANSFASGRPAEYSRLIETLAGHRVQIRRIRGDRPLQANWGRTAEQGGELVAAARS